MDAAPSRKCIRVAVRVRPLLNIDGATGTSLLQLDPGRPNEVVLASATDKRTGRRYVFDHVFGPDVPQGHLYRHAGVSEMVAAAASGYHATIFAYGQTGSGKTFTMEGYKYSTHGSGAGGAKAPAKDASTPTAAGAAAGSKGKAGSGGVGGPPPSADFGATPEDQLGLTPRAVRDLFAIIAKQQQERRFTVRCSFVQIYKEQVYDLLNPATLGSLPGSGVRRATGGSGVAVGGPLRLRWSAQEDFHLENLYAPEVESAEEAIAAFQAGVVNKVMSSHRLNASSSRSHCLFTLTITSSPHESPLEVTTARLTLVDLAGSERAALTGATEGALRDESVFINKSLFTLRQVITALTDAAAAAAKDAAANGSGAVPAAAAVHVPYRDSKLTCLLKHSLGGNSLTLMMACVSPGDRFFEENASTLDYAARARKITNQVAVNEDPKSRLIRELRAEVAFLRQQLEAAGVSGLHALPAHLMAPPGAGGGAGSGAGAAAARRASSGAGGGLPRHPGGDAAAAAGGGGAGLGALAAGGAAQGEDEDEAAYASRLRAADVEVLVRSVIEASRVAVSSSQALGGLRAAYARTCGALEALRAQHDLLAGEDARLRDRVAMLEALVGPAPHQGGGGAGGEGGGAPYTATSAAYIELEELRRENALLHERLQLLDPGGAGGSSYYQAVSLQGGGGALSGPPGSSQGTQRRPGTTASGAGAASKVPRGGGGAAAPYGAGGGSTGKHLVRAHSAGALRATVGRGGGGRGPAGGAAGPAAAAAAAAAANPFAPRDVLMAVMPQHQHHPPTHGSVLGGASSTSLRLSTAAGDAPATRPTTSASLAASRDSSRPMTVDQLRALLERGAGGGGGGGGPSTAARSSSFGASDAGAAVGGAGPEGQPGLPATADLLPPGTPAGRPPVGGGLVAYAGGRPPGTPGSPAASGAASRLTELHHTVASRALVAGVRLSTTGGLLPTAAARIAVEAAGGGAASGAGSSGAGGVAEGGYGAGTSRPATAASVAAAGGGDAQVLAQLLADRNALTRQRLTQ